MVVEYELKKLIFNIILTESLRSISAIKSQNDFRQRTRSPKVLRRLTIR